MTTGPHERLDNGLRAPAYVPLTDVEAEVGRQLLAALGRARIAAYLGDPPLGGEHRRLFVAAEERGDARTIVRATVRSLGTSATELADDDPGSAGGPGAGVPLAQRGDPLAGLDADAIFAELVADWHVDTHAAIRQAERDLTREDSDWRARLVQPPVEQEPAWLDDDHFVPPPPPPLPRLSLPTVLGMLVLVVAIFLLAAGTVLGLADNVARVLGIAGLLVGVGILLTRVRDFHRDEDDDGAAL